VEGVKLTESENRSTEYGKRNAIYFVIDKHGVLKMNGEKLPESDPVSFINTTRNSYGPYPHAVLVIHSKTPMWKITDLISQIKAAGLTRILFSTDSQKE
jgi:biopolymer transport protein ExbD